MNQDKYFKEVWREAEDSLCLKKKVGAVLVNLDLDVILGYGHGGAIAKCKRCFRKEYDWQQDGCWSIHAEMRALFNAFNKHGYKESYPHCVMFTSHGPCDQCLKYMVFFGIKGIVYDVDYHNDYSKWTGLIQVFKRGEDVSNIL